MKIKPSAEAVIANSCPKGHCFQKDGYCADCGVSVQGDSWRVSQ